MSAQTVNLESMPAFHRQESHGGRNTLTKQHLRWHFAYSRVKRKSCSVLVVCRLITSSARRRRSTCCLLSTWFPENFSCSSSSLSSLLRHKLPHDRLSKHPSPLQPAHYFYTDIDLALKNLRRYILEIPWTDCKRDLWNHTEITMHTSF